MEKTTAEYKPTQCEKVLKVLRDAKGEWVNGQYFLRQMFLSQYHCRIFQLQEKGHVIEASDFRDKHGFKSYRLIEKPETEKMKL